MDRETVISAFTLAQQYDHELVLEDQLPKMGFPFLNDYHTRREQLIVDFSKFAVNHDSATGCKTRAVDGRVNLKGKKALVAEVAWALFQPSKYNEPNKKPVHICSTRGYFAFEHSRMMMPSEAATREICRENRECNCAEPCILNREFTLLTLAAGFGVERLRLAFPLSRVLLFSRVSPRLSLRSPLPPLHIAACCWPDGPGWFCFAQPSTFPMTA